MTVTKHLLSAVLCLGAVASATPAASAARAPRTGVVVSACTMGDTAATRAVTFTATTAKRSRSTTMAMRFFLVRRQPVAPTVAGVPATGAAPATIPLTRWTSWVRSKPGRSAFIVTRRVDGLTGPAEYLVRVQMRWYDKKGTRLFSVEKESPACAQPDYGPDLVIESGTVAADGSAVEVVVANRGRTASHQAGVTVLVGGLQLGAATVPALAPGRTATVRAPLQSCPAGSPLLAAVTSAAEDGEASSSNNTASYLTCPG